MCDNAQIMTTAILHKKAHGNELKAYTSQAVNDMLTDPDFGMELSAKAKNALRAARGTKEKTISLAAVIKKYY
jgi:hypothetical protein